jgi:exodeoxyribonuclease VII small subunit
MSATPTPANEPTSDQPRFEDALKRLEEIVHALEEGDLGLNDSLQHYEEGVKLLRQSYDLLQRAERRIELLSGVDAEGNPITQPFDDSATFDAAQGGSLSHNAEQASDLPNDSAAPGKRRKSPRGGSRRLLDGLDE